MNNDILETFKQAGIPLNFDTFTGYWFHEDRSMSTFVQLFPDRDARGLPFVIGVACVGDSDYSLDHPTHLWMEQFSGVAELLANGKPPF